MSNCTSLQQKIGTPVIRKEMGRREGERGRGRMRGREGREGNYRSMQPQ